MGILIGVFLTRGNFDITFDYGWVRCLAEFMIGAIVYQFFSQRYGQVWLSKDSSFYVLGLSIVIALHFILSDILFIPLFALLLLCAAYNTGAVNRILERKTLRYLGDISYSIYMMHGFWFLVYWFVMTYLKSEMKITSLPFLHKFGIGISFVSLMIITAHYSYRHIEIKAR